MNIEVIPADWRDETTFRNLFQFYLYEFSRFMGWSPNYAGRFGEDDLDGCWTQPNRHPFLVKVDDQLAGLVIIDQSEKSHLSSDENIVDVAEFFILAGFQGKKVGEYVATHLFDLFPGKWEIAQLSENVNAQQFWRKIIGRYTDGDYHEGSFRRGIFQSFDTSLE